MTIKEAYSKILADAESDAGPSAVKYVSKGEFHTFVYFSCDDGRLIIVPQVEIAED